MVFVGSAFNTARLNIKNKGTIRLRVFQEKNLNQKIVIHSRNVIPKAEKCIMLIIIASTVYRHIN